MAIYVVRTGDNVDRIAAAYGIDVQELIWANQISYPYRLAVGQALYIPRMPENGGGEKRPLYSFGYAYPYITDDTLAATLPYLTDLYVFSYGFTAEGELLPPAADDTRVVQRTLVGGVRPILVLTPLDAGGHFNNHLVTTVVKSRSTQARLAGEILVLMQQRGYQGLDIDFEYVEAADREGYAEFVSRMRQTLNLYGYPVTVALAPKTSAGQTGLLYEGIDYRLLGAAADRVMLMTYEWGYTYEPISIW